MDLTEAEAQLVLWETALGQTSKSQSYTINGRTLNRADVAEIRQTIDWLEGKILTLQRASGTRRQVNYVG